MLGVLGVSGVLSVLGVSGVLSVPCVLSGVCEVLLMFSCFLRAIFFKDDFF